MDVDPYRDTGFRLLASKVSCGRWQPGTTEVEKSFTIRACHEEGSGGEIRAAVAARALDRQARRDAIKNLGPSELKKPEQAGRMTRSCARRGGRGCCCVTVSSVRPSSRGVLLIQVQAWLMVPLAMIVTWQKKVWKLLRPEKASAKGREREKRRPLSSLRPCQPWLRPPCPGQAAEKRV
eukprot:360958-Chlamydomonas_euryale.AAC.3